MPLSGRVIYIPLSLAASPRHGYSILKDVAELSEGRLKLGTGTLYGALSRLLDDHCIERFQEQEAQPGRQIYRLTALGRRALSSEVERLQRLAGVSAITVKVREA